MDFGADGLLECASVLNSAGIRFVGAGSTPKEARAPAILDVRGVSVGLLGYCDDFRARAGELARATPAEAHHETILRDICELRSRVDLLIMHLHWGYEFQVHPLLPHRDRARQYADAGADIVLCHHAHVPMAVEAWGQSVIAHGLGNFLFPRSPYMRQGHPLTARTFMVEIRFDRDGPTAARLVPTGIAEDGTVSALRGGARREMLGIQAAAARALGHGRRLRRFYRDRVARETIAFLEVILRLARTEPAKLHELADSLAVPRQQELVAELRRWPTAVVCDALAALDRLRRCREDAAECTSLSRQLSESALREAIRRLRRHARVPYYLPGRVP